MSDHDNNNQDTNEVKKVSLAELMKRKLESQKQNQNNGPSFSNTGNNSNNKLKSQHNKQSTLKRSRSGE